MAQLDLIQLSISLPINIDPNEEQNKFEGNVSKNVAKMVILWPVIGQRQFGACDSLGHNLAIFIQFWQSNTPKRLSVSRRIK